MKNMNHMYTELTKIRTSEPWRHSLTLLNGLNKVIYGYISRISLKA